MSHLTESERARILAKAEADFLGQPAPEAPRRPPTPPNLGMVRLILTITNQHYVMRGIPTMEVGDLRCYEVRKLGGLTYHVSEHADGCRCTCADFEIRRKHRDPLGCKHVRALAELGLLNNQPVSPHRTNTEERWPARVRDGHGVPFLHEYQIDDVEGPELSDDRDC